MSVPAQPINGSVRMTIASLAEAELRRATKERAELVTKLRKVNATIAEMETQLAVAGVETESVPEAET